MNCSDTVPGTGIFLGVLESNMTEKGNNGYVRVVRLFLYSELSETIRE